MKSRNREAIEAKIKTYDEILLLNRNKMARTQEETDNVAKKRATLVAMLEEQDGGSSIGRKDTRAKAQDRAPELARGDQEQDPDNRAESVGRGTPRQTS